jgi:hypothetical protein
VIPQSARVPLVSVEIGGKQYQGFITLPWYQYLNIQVPSATGDAKKSRPPVVLNLGASSGGNSFQQIPIPGPRGPAGQKRATGLLLMQQPADTPALPMMPANLPKHGAYTPTLTNVLNLDASTAYACQYTTIGRVVTVSGRVDVDPTAAGAARIGLSLPISSNFAAANECGGVAFSSTGQGAAISGDAANNRADFNFTAIGTANIAMQFVFQYRII